LSIERTFIENFVVKNRQERYVNLVATNRGRIKLRKYIAHFKDLALENIQDIRIESAGQLYSLLTSKGAPSQCYIISENSNYDGKFLELKNAIEELFGSGISYFLCAIPEKLNYYESEDSSDRFILIK
jgi:hypothetical protein